MLPMPSSLAEETVLHTHMMLQIKIRVLAFLAIGTLSAKPEALNQPLQIAVGHREEHPHPSIPLMTYVNSGYLPSDAHQPQVVHCLRMYVNGICSDDCHDALEPLPVNLSYTLYNHSTPDSVLARYGLCHVGTLGYSEPSYSANLARVLNLLSVALLLSLLAALK